MRPHQSCYREAKSLRSLSAKGPPFRRSSDHPFRRSSDHRAPTPRQGHRPQRLRAWRGGGGSRDRAIRQYPPPPWNVQRSSQPPGLNDGPLARIQAGQLHCNKRKIFLRRLQCRGLLGQMTVPPGDCAWGGLSIGYTYPCSCLCPYLYLSVARSVPVPMPAEHANEEAATVATCPTCLVPNP